MLTTPSRRHLLAAALLLALTPAGAAQGAFNPEWVNPIGSATYDAVAGLASDPQGNVIVAGSTGSDWLGTLGNREGFVRKLSPAGKVLWTTLISTLEKDDIFGMTADAAGNIYVAGGTGGELQSGGQVGRQDAFVAKLTPGGKVVWIKQFGSSEDDSVRAVALGPKGALSIMGITKGTLPGGESEGGQDTFVAQLSESGELVWMHQLGNEFDDVAGGIAVDEVGHVYAAGSIGTNDIANLDGFLAQFDAAGRPLWAKTYATGGQSYIQGLAVRGDTVVLVGNTTTVLPGQQSAGPGEYGTNNDAFVIRVDPKGATKWIRQFGGRGTDSAYGVTIAGNGDVLVTGEADGGLFDQKGQGEYDVFVSRYTAGGERLWTRLFGTPQSDYGFRVLPTNDALFVAGVSFGPISGKPAVKDVDAFVARLPVVPAGR
ncbi:SBBP repeat-containing protein [Deinococcus humi]|uniref:Beta-propeller repeat protein n=1 Tax=Deinococcus humi TaxID=662880 RepID=A0A7W8JYR4_9DEIO|nr:SBBP repeat-containing protein [Deinococcus humi]MBB5365288.1 hypothetical protein [Deinococcus humi]GGO35911.1 hypothetical protein GCM10008949_39120 [Deinococcus humi]